MRIGLLGSGARAAAIAGRLLEAGHQVSCAGPEVPAGFLEQGGRVAAGLPALAAGAEFIFLCLAEDTALAATMAGLDPLLGERHVLLCLGHHPAEAKMAARAVAQRRGARLLDAELSGAAATIRAGSATILLAGAAEDAAAATPLLGALGPHIVRVAGFGQAGRMKLVTDYLVAVHAAAAAEALLIGERLGLSPEEIVRAAGRSKAASAVLAERGPAMAARHYGVGDLERLAGLFDLLGGSGAAEGAPLLAATAPLFRAAVSAGFGGSDIAAVREALAPPLPTPPAPGRSAKGKAQEAARHEREAAALRRNLGRRRAQARARAAPPES